MSGGTRKRTRRAATRGKLRRETVIDGVTVERPFNLFSGEESSGQGIDSGAGSAADDSASTNSSSIGDGCYISATVSSRRYYGVLIDQGALKAASELHFRSEAESLDLNWRMMALQRQQKKKTENYEDRDGDGDPSAVGKAAGVDPDKKRPRIAFSSSSRAAAPSSALPLDDRPIQKFRYVDPRESGDASGSSPGYRLLIATYADVAAASEDFPERAPPIRSACQSGGNFVGDYYYQYEVRYIFIGFLAKSCKCHSACRVINGCAALKFHYLIEFGQPFTRYD